MKKNKLVASLAILSFIVTMTIANKLFPIYKNMIFETTLVIINTFLLIFVKKTKCDKENKQFIAVALYYSIFKGTLLLVFPQSINTDSSSIDTLNYAPLFIFTLILILLFRSNIERHNSENSA